MKLITINLFIGILILFVLPGCQEEKNISIYNENGTVVDYAGSGNCGFVIELDNGKSILPIIYPDDFIFAHGQKVWVEYNEMPDLTAICDKGAACEIKSVEQLGCASWVDLYFNNYDSLARDPVYVHEVYLDDDCLHMKLSYSGGCQEHTIDLARMHPWCATPPLPPPTFEIRHNANGDMCEAYITKELRFDMSGLIEEGEKTFTVNILMPGDETYNETFEYNWE